MSASRQHQRGVALLVTLILLVMMSVLAGRISQQFCRSLQKTRYQTSQQQLRWAIQAQTPGIKDRLESHAGSPEKALEPEGEWRDPLMTSSEFYTVESQISDMQNCFNVNSLLSDDAPADAANEPTGALPEKPVNEVIAEKLFEHAGMSPQTAQEVFSQMRDYLDQDDTTPEGGSENDAWLAQKPPRLPANQMMRTLSEIKLLPAFPEQSYARLSAVMCVLPETENVVDINTLTVAQAPLLSALFSGALNEDDAIRLITSRPKEGWESVKAFTELLANQYAVPAEALEKSQAFLAVNSRYFRVDSTGTTDDLTLRVVTLFRLDNGEAIPWQRRYRIIE